MTENECRNHSNCIKRDCSGNGNQISAVWLMDPDTNFWIGMSWMSWGLIMCCSVDCKNEDPLVEKIGCEWLSQCETKKRPSFEIKSWDNIPRNNDRSTELSERMFHLKWRSCKDDLYKSIQTTWSKFVEILMCVSNLTDAGRAMWIEKRRKGESECHQPQSKPDILKAPASRKSKLECWVIWSMLWLSTIWAWVVHLTYTSPTRKMNGKALDRCVPMLQLPYKKFKHFCSSMKVTIIGILTWLNWI